MAIPRGGMDGTISILERKPAITLCMTMRIVINEKASLNLSISQYLTLSISLSLSFYLIFHSFMNKKQCLMKCNHDRLGPNLPFKLSGNSFGVSSSSCRGEGRARGDNERRR